MKKSHFVLVGILALTIGSAFAVHAMPEVPSGTSVLRIGQKTMTVHLAKTRSEVTKGLSGRNRLAEDEGMLFYFDTPDVYTFWMPDMRFALDIIWIRDGVVQEVATLGIPVQGEPIPIYTPRMMADRVLEIDAGLAERYGLMPGAKVSLPE